MGSNPTLSAIANRRILLTEVSPRGVPPRKPVAWDIFFTSPARGRGGLVGSNPTLSAIANRRILLMEVSRRGVPPRKRVAWDIFFIRPACGRGGLVDSNPTLSAIPPLRGALPSSIRSGGAEIRAANVIVGAEVMAWAFQRHAAGFHHVAVVGDLEGIVGVLGGQQNGDALARDLADVRENFIDEHRRESERRLVEHQQHGISHQTAADRAHLLLAPGKRAGSLAAPLLQAREHRIDALQIALRASPERAREGAEQKIFFGGHSRPELPPFGNHAEPPPDPRVRRLAGDVFAAEEDLAAQGGQYAGNDAQRRGFACAVRADQADDLALLDFEADVLQRRAAKKVWSAAAQSSPSTPATTSTR